MFPVWRWDSKGGLQCSWLTSQRVTVQRASRLASFERHPGFSRLMNNTNSASLATRLQYVLWKLSRYTAVKTQRELEQGNSSFSAENKRRSEQMRQSCSDKFESVNTAIPWELIRRTLHYVNIKKQRNRDYIGLWKLWTKCRQNPVKSGKNDTLFFFIKYIFWL